ncbi:Eco57I restriction-modification methylase domain-containing protein [Fusobacterium periodonticum]|uniref:site-specific DNA-methyltransferase (adenine-specific) n=1 Tax=Fusobacterium periodonticum ATCC 33693 TaxID=546275 RepID=D4CS05_9FUSO|nr:TaqI-like C-terminal specificity domain-containing protein [Fusobacterium periodonticum]EFE87872.1 Eco57I restriction endonuclease [Fusobacterium periodonticum ATCC 33693]
MNNLFNQKLLVQKAQEEINLNDYIEKREVLNNWINSLEKGILAKSKEEEFQGEFLNDIFSLILGALNKSSGKDEWNLQRETKTKIDGQKADGVIGFFDINEKDDVRAVIELKGPTISLDQRQKRSGDTRTPVEQAFNYAPKYGKNCQWVIVSNYKEIRLYRSNDMTEYEVFFLENLKDDLEFQKFVYILSFEALVGTTDKKAKALELSEEYQKNQIEIEKKFYNEYRNIRLHIFENIKENNPEINENLLLEKVQKLLDRFLFICFCEDKGLLEKDFFNTILKKGKDFGSIFDIFKVFCNWINLGNPKENIAHFNGGLFKNDDVLNSLNIDDKVFEELKKISDYDFDSDLNVNILGHIFEQSISDIEELKKSISGEEFDQKKSKRKKDGIFYTPQYITKYIVENSIKNWLDDKRKELGEDDLPKLNEKDYIFDIAKKNYTKNYRKHIEFWQQYREAVRNIKVIDPACGSGAFLITAFEFLLNYNKYLDDKIFDLVGTSDLFSDRTKEILQNNIFGVDLNKESVEITKLSLWLKTADKNKTLASLENNIKCGNSLIDDPEIAGDLAFNWEKEFPEVFANGGFDIVVGNPPYVLCQPSNTNEKILKFYNNFEVSSYKIDLYHLFFEKGIILSKNNGYISFITPNTYLVNKYNLKLREFILRNTQIKEIINYKNIVFEDANVDVSTIILKKSKYTDENVKILLSSKNENKIVLEKQQNDWLKDDEKIFNLRKEFPINFSNCISLKEIAKTYFGIQAFDKKSSISQKKENEKYLPMIDGANVFRYQFSKYNQYFNFIDDNIKSGGDYKVYEKERIVIRQIGKTPIIGYCEANILTSNTIYNIFSITDKFNLKYIFTLLNSKLLKKYWEYKYNDNKNLFPKIKGYQLDDLPLVNIPLEKQQPFIEKADKMLSLNRELQDLSQKFQRMVLRKFDLEKLSTKLQEWHLLDFSDFIKELKRLKVKLSLSQESEWEEYFLEEKSKAIAIDSEIKATDKEIDSMVYKLYDLTDEEIKIIEEE